MLKIVNSKKIIPAVIMIFWIVMMGLLLNRYAFSNEKISAYTPFLSKDALLSDEWLGVYFNNTLIGFIHTTIEPCLLKKGVSGYRIANHTFMNFLVMQKQNKVWFDAETLVDENYGLSGFNFNFNSGSHRLKVSGGISGGKNLSLEINSQGLISKREIVLPDNEGMVIADIISPFSRFGTLKSGAYYNMRVFNPFTLEIEPLEIKVCAKETVKVKDNLLDSFLVKSRYNGMEQLAWVSPKGEILKEETALGWVILKDDADVAGRLYESMGKTGIELTNFVSLASNVTMNPPDLKYAVIALNGVGKGFNLESQRQKTAKEDKTADLKIVEIVKEAPDEKKTLDIPISVNEEFLEPSDFVQAEDAAIKEAAKKIIGQEKNSFKAAQKINQWVYQNIRKVPVVSVPSAIDVLKTREGDCNEHTVLFVALARAAGIPAKIHVGLVYMDGRFYYHAWPSVYTGQWLDMDPTFGQDIADISHIKFIEGDIAKQLEIVRLLGKIKLEVLQYK